MTVRLLHLADLHLDSAYGGRDATRARLRTATIEALRTACRYAVDERLHAVLIAGDLFDDERLGYEARAALRGEVTRLARAGIDVVIVTGNHDPGAPGRRAAGLGLDRLAQDDARLGEHAGQVIVALDGRPRTVTLVRDGQPYLHVALAGHAHSQVTDDLASNLKLPLLGDGLPAVAVLHTQVGSARGADGHAPYAPSTPATLRDAGFDYWALGHVHVQGRATPDAPAWYAGNLVGRNAKETGPKGGLLVELDGDGLVAEPTPLRFAPVQHEIIELSGGPHETPESLARAAADAWRARAADAAPELILRLTGAVLEDAFERELRRPDPRRSAEDAVRDELEAALAGPRLLEVQLRLTAAGRTEPVRLGGPSALAEAMELAGAVAMSGELPTGPAGPLDPETSRARDANELRRMAERVREELQRRAASLIQRDQ